MRGRRQFLISPATEDHMEEMEDTGRLVLGFFGIVSALILYLIPMKSFIRALKKRSMREFCPTPYLMRLYNCWCFMVYCVLCISPNDSICWANILGFVIYSFYVLVKYKVQSLEEGHDFFSKIYFGTAIPLHTLAIIAVAFLDGDVRYYFWGTILTSFTIIMHAFTTWKRLRLVIITETVEPISLVSSFFLCLNGLLWCAYGFLFLGKDPVVSISNGFECGVGAIELSLYVKYLGNKAVLKLG